MTARYHQIMDRIQVDESMRLRVLEGAMEKAARRPRRRWLQLAIAACAALAVMGGALLPTLTAPAPQPDPPPVLTNPVLSTPGSLKELEEAAGFSVPDLTDLLPFPVSSTEYAVRTASMAQVTYSGEGGETAVFRKSPGGEDNSGDYTVYDAQTELTLGTIPITLKGDSTGYCLSLWREEGFSCSLRLSSSMDQAWWESFFAAVLS